MLKKLLKIIVVWLLGVAPAYADCVDVIRASALKGTVVEGAASIDTEASMFCSEYASAKQAGKSLNVSGSYSGIGIGVGSSSTKVEQVASKYCDSSNGYKARSSSYSQYVETIAPGAFSAYSDCIRGNGSIVADLPPNAISASDLTILVSNRASVAAPQQVAFTASPGFDCLWLGAKASKSGSFITINPTSTTTLQCRRKNQSQEGSIAVVGTSSVNGTYMFAWKKFQGGLPVDELKAIRDANLDLVRTLGSAIVAFDGTSCPAGWSPVTGLAGRTIVGAGAGNGLTPRTNGEVGGEEAHTLVVGEIPAHTHEVTFTDHNGTPTKIDYSANEYGFTNAKETSSSTGGGLPHNNMQPFAVYQFCRRNI